VRENVQLASTSMLQREVAGAGTNMANYANICWSFLLTADIVQLCTDDNIGYLFNLAMREREGQFLFQRLSDTLQSYNSLKLHDSFRKFLESPESLKVKDIIIIRRNSTFSN